MKKGFTLVELLGVIVLIALLMIIVLPNIVNSVRSSSNQTDDLTLQLIYDAADLYISNHKSDFPKENGNKYIINLKDLIDEEILVSPIKLSDKDITNNKCIQVTYQDDFNYELKDSGSCEELKLICKAVTQETATKYTNDSTKTIGNVPLGDGTYNAGDEYICEVGPGISYRFYVLTTVLEGETTVNLIMNQNINSDGSVATTGVIKSGNNIYNLVEWHTDSNNTFGPLTALNFLKKATAKWTYLDKMTINKFSDNEGNTHNMQEYRVYARLPYESEIVYTYQEMWLINYLKNENYTGVTVVPNIYGYWTFTSSKSITTDAYPMYCNGDCGTYQDNISNNIYGIRPVITLPITSLY